MFFYLSKILWFFADPGNLFLIVLLSGFVFSAFKFARLGKSLISLALVGALVLTFVPVGGWLIAVLENRFPSPEVLSEEVDGIIVLGGVINPAISKTRSSPAIGGAIERITESAQLARRYPSAPILYTGGSGSLFNQDFKEADYVSQIYVDLGIDKDRIILEREARNTAENAIYSYRHIKPSQNDRWILVTSGFHMPRAIGVFRKIGWNVIPYPVDFYTDPAQTISSPLSFAAGLSALSHGIHEWIGLFAYWFTGKTNAAFPRPFEKVEQ